MISFPVTNEEDLTWYHNLHAPPREKLGEFVSAVGSIYYWKFHGWISLPRHVLRLLCLCPLVQRGGVWQGSTNQDDQLCQGKICSIFHCRQGSNIQWKLVGKTQVCRRLQLDWMVGQDSCLSGSLGFTIIDDSRHVLFYYLVPNH